MDLKKSKLGQFVWVSDVRCPGNKRPENQAAGRQYVVGIPIKEANRATVYETRKAGIEILKRWEEHYLRTNVNAVLVGVPAGKLHKFAVFVESGFLQTVPDENE